MEPPAARAPESPSRDPDLDRHIRASVDRALQHRGFMDTGAEEADFLVGYRLADSTGLEILNVAREGEDAAPDGVLVYSHLPESDRGHQTAVWGLGPPRSYQRKFNERSLVIELVRPGTTNILWRGFAGAEVRAGQSRDLQYRQIDQAVRKTLRAFPPN
jgi:hypothetical protein